ncbi:MAG: hypothetical protein N4A59_06710 [Marinifilum sp.]|nr:hypothetical protein [Marinifilum sp.]
MEVEIFLLLKESVPQNQWMNNNEELALDFNQVQIYIKEFIQFITSSEIENYQGFYDSSNIKNFIENLEYFKDKYPNPIHRTIQINLSKEAWINWRDSKIQSVDKNYTIFNQEIKDHTFCEIAERKTASEDHNYALINHSAYNLASPISVTINEHDKVEVESLSTVEEIFNWFTQNRIPKRNFHINPKHGENRQDERLIHNELISPLMCSAQEAKILLQTAIGNNRNELFNFDKERNHFIVFKYEGNTPENLYHGYHVPTNSNEVPDWIKNKLL